MASAVILTETFDTKMMNLLLDHSRIGDFDKKKLRSYFKMRKNGNEVQVTYDFGKNAKIGRIYPKNLIGFAGFERNIRNALTKSIYNDIDIKNCHPTILLQVCEKQGWTCDNLKQYTKERDNILMDICQFYETTKDVAKQLFIIISFGGSFKTWFSENQASIFKNQSETFQFVNDFQKEIKIIAKNLWNSDLTSIIKKDNLSSCMALFLQNEERKIILAVKQAFESKGRSVDALIYDGCLIKKNKQDDVELESVMRYVECSVLETQGYAIELVKKPIETNLKFEDEKYIDSSILVDDVYAASQFVRILGDEIVFCEGNLYVFNHENGLWTKDTSVIRKYINCHNDDMKFKQIDNEGKVQIFNYSGKETNIINMLKNCCIFCQDDLFFNTRLDSSKGKLLFEDGIYDFEKDTFNKGFDPNIIFYGRISRPYNRNVDEEIIEKVHKILFRDPFYDEDFECADFLLIGLSRAMAGEYEAKKSYFGIGDSNAGKGVLTDALDGAFEDYIGYFNSSALSYNPLSTTDMAKQMSWVIDIANKRVSIANECRSNKPLDSKIYKELVSGGDKIKARKNHKDEVDIINRSTLLILANDISEFNPPDDSIKNRVNYINYKRTFHDPDTYQGDVNDAEFRAADKSLRSKFKKNVDYKDAVVNIIIRGYQRNLIEGHKIPKAVVDTSEAWSGVQMSFKQRIQKYIEITWKEEDYVDCEYINKCIKKNEKLDMTDTKIGIEMRKLLKGRKSEVITNKKNTRVYKGVKKIVFIDDLEVEFD